MVVDVGSAEGFEDGEPDEVDADKAGKPVEAQEYKEFSLDNLFLFEV